MIPTMLEDTSKDDKPQAGGKAEQLFFKSRNVIITGEINHKKIFEWLYNRKYDGVIGMEHGNSKPGAEGELAVIAAYREVDSY